jgi:hypothetical protein
MAELRAALARGGATLETRGAKQQLETSDCDDPRAACVRCDLASEDQFPNGVAAVARGFARYPRHVLEAAKVERVAICRTLRYGDGTRTPTGISSHPDHLLAISFEQLSGEGPDVHPVYTAEDTVHHELFHLLDSETSPMTFANDPEWEKLNPRDFVYGTTRDRDTRGFLDPYAWTNVVEDRAVVFQHLMARPEATCERAKRDPNVRAKIALLAKRLAARIDIAFLTERAPCVRQTTASSSTSTSHAGSMNRLTSTKVDAGRIAPNTSP